jgi:hypothetical protein
MRKFTALFRRRFSGCFEAEADSKIAAGNGSGRAKTPSPGKLRSMVRRLWECKAGQLLEDAGDIVNWRKKGFLWKAVWI